MKLKKKKNLINQIRLYSVDTSAFYNNDEQRIADSMLPLYLRRKYLYDEVDKMNKISEDINKQRRKERNSNSRIEIETAIDRRQVKNYNRSTVRECKKQISMISKNIEYIKKTKLYPLFVDNKKVRSLREDAITYDVTDSEGQPTGKRKNKRNVEICMFESELTRTLGVNKNEFTDGLIIVEQLYQDVAEQLIKRGFWHRNKLYKFYASSSGQIRTKKLVMIREDLWDEHSGTLMCGLTMDHINNNGGMNVNKLIAYMALQASASSRFEGFDINRVLVCNDLELNVEGLVDHISNQTFKITRKTMDIPMNVTDGAGMCLPSVSELSFQFRSNWMKGLISPFDFKKWIIQMREKYPENKNIGVVKDVWGKSHDVIKENIQIILCKSMFKMHSFYSSWKDFKEKFVKNNCHAAVCQIEDRLFGNVKLGYQMIQSLSELKDEEIDKIIHKTVNDIENIGRDKNVMLKLLGATPENSSKNYYQQALEILPELLSDTYSKEIIKSTKKSVVKNAKAGKVEVEGKYLFAVPDWWAYCEWLMMGIDKNELTGLLQGEEVYSNKFDDGQKLDILRSPHLWREHGCRVNKKDKMKQEWFISNGMYIGHKSLLPKLLMLDFDGDQLFCVSDPAVVVPAEEHMKGIVPLHYELAKAGPSIINEDSIYKGLKDAFSVKIGTISNNISIVWNSNNIDMDVLKWSCLINNEIIDFAKTLYKSKIPKGVANRIKLATKGKLPHLFVYAKDMDKGDVQSDSTPSVMNRLAKKIPNPNIYFRKVVNDLDFTLLMNNQNISIDDEIIELYKSLDLKKWTMSMQASDKDATGDNLAAYLQIRDELLSYRDYDAYQVVDMLIKHLYENEDSTYKTTLWSSFGDIIVENIKINLARRKFTYLECECGEKYIKETQRQDKCRVCMDKREKEKAALRLKKYRKNMKR